MAFHIRGIHVPSSTKESTLEILESSPPINPVTPSGNAPVLYISRGTTTPNANIAPGKTIPQHDACQMWCTSLSRLQLTYRTTKCIEIKFVRQFANGTMASYPNGIKNGWYYMSFLKVPVFQDDLPRDSLWRDQSTIRSEQISTVPRRIGISKSVLV
jgi:hypothetical protein